MAANDRKISYKLPPTIITDRLISQEARRGKALEEQKRRRAQRVDSSRQLDLFSDLNLGASDDEDSAQSPKDVTGVSLASIAPYASMLEGSVLPEVTNDAKTPVFAVREMSGSKKPKKRRRNKNNKSNRWADKCMYAELLEMASGDTWPTSNDGLPTDLESGWVAVGPVPVGKRCLAVTHQSSGIAGAVPNTTLRSRLLGKVLIPRFPSILPPLTILDCILDSNWRENGILHVLDVIKWKGQDVGECETPFRFWWRDTRLTELSQSSPPVMPSMAANISQSDQYQFPYPTTFLPVPYHTDTTLPTLSKQVIPLARSTRSIRIDIPTLQSNETSMEVDASSRIPPTLISVNTDVPSDGLLLYVTEASYEAGTSPLSSWIPLTSYEESHTADKGITLPSSDGPLDLFQRLVERKLHNSTQYVSRAETAMEMDE